MKKLLNGLSTVQKVIYGCLAFLALVSSAYGITKIFVLKPVHDMQIAGVAAQILQMQQNNAVERARSDVRYWQRELREIKKECAANWTQECKMRYDETMIELKRAQARLDELSK